MFPRRMFAGRYFVPTYFPPVSGEADAVSIPVPWGAHSPGSFIDVLRDDDEVLHFLIGR